MNLDNVLWLGPGLCRLPAVVMAEASTGGHNRLNGPGELVRGHGVLFMTDLLTVWGGLPMEFDRHGIDYCYSGSQKRIGFPSGLAPATVLARAHGPLVANRIRIETMSYSSYSENVDRAVGALKSTLS